MIAVLLLVAVIVIFLTTGISAAVAKNVINSMDRRSSSGSIDQSLVEARLTRIEEAIDAMALQIERLSEHQRSLLGSPPADDRKLPDDHR